MPQSWQPAGMCRLTPDDPPKRPNRPTSVDTLLPYSRPRQQEGPCHVHYLTQKCPRQWSRGGCHPHRRDHPDHRRRSARHAGVVGLATNEFYVATQKWIFQFDVTTWGWIHILVGVIAVLAGIGLYSGAVWARTLGVIVAAVSILANFAWLPYYPIWAVVIIVFDFFVIWALTGHGRDVTRVNDR